MPMSPRDLEDEFNDDLDDREDPDESDMDDSDHPELIPCPYCRESIAEDAERCHHCGSFILDEDQPRTFPTWIIISGTIILILMAWLVLWLFHTS
jgi:predicted nucleic acid-binding Zn ribbon protein